SLDASAGTLTAGLLTVHDAVLRKRGDWVTASAAVTESDLRTAIPVLQSVVPVASGGGELTLRGTATVLGVTASVDATARAQNGRVGAGRGGAGDRGVRGHPPERGGAFLRVAVEERERHPLDHSELGLRVRVGREVRGGHQRHQVFGRRRGVEERVGERRRV